MCDHKFKLPEAKVIVEIHHPEHGKAANDAKWVILYLKVIKWIGDSFGQVPKIFGNTETGNRNCGFNMLTHDRNFQQKQLCS